MGAPDGIQPNQGKKRRKDYGDILESAPVALEIGRLCREEGLQMWIPTPKHSVMEMRSKAMGFEIWHMRATTYIKVFLRIGLSKSEFGMLDFRYLCEQTGGENALLLLTTRAGLPSDIRRGWSRKLALDSCKFGDVVDAEWATFPRMPLLSGKKRRDISHNPKSAISDATLECYRPTDLESDSDVMVSGLERTRWTNATVKDPI